MPVIRFWDSLEQDLLNALDEYVEENSLPSRSQAVRHLINNNLVKKKWKYNNIVAGSITLVYEHNKKDIVNNLTKIQHGYHNTVLPSQHFHLNDETYLEIVAVKGIKHGKLTMSKAD
ncbi:MAG: nickel-responsive transcriptional regulator NikR [Ignavibacteria bacterium]|jgi:CopG family nickel-responsive transcriptional regulator